MKKTTKETIKSVVNKIVKPKPVEVVKEAPKVDRQNPGFDPDIPESKQRWLR